MGKYINVTGRLISYSESFDDEYVEPEDSIE